MKKTITNITLVLIALTNYVYAQTIVPAVFPDNYINSLSLTQTVNTGVAIAPDVTPSMFNFTVSVYDGVTPSGYEIEIDDNNTTTTLQKLSGKGLDPDVAFGNDPGYFFVASVNNGKSINIDEYKYNVMSYRLRASYPVVNVGPNGNVRYPNIDINSLNEGVIVYEHNGKIQARAFYHNGISLIFLSGPAFVGFGTQPDVAMHEFNYVIKENYTVTYIDTRGDLQIVNADFNTLLTSAFVMPNALWSYTPLSPGDYSYPRISTIHNDVLFPTYSEFTVVTTEPGQDQITGFFFDGFTMNTYINISNSVPNCAFAQYPVVSYQFDRVVVVWYSTWVSCPSYVGGFGEGILKEELDFMGTTLTGFTFDEVNLLSSYGVTVPAKPSVTNQYDGLSPIPLGYYNESVVFQNGFDIYWKNRSNAGPVLSYKQNENNSITDFDDKNSKKEIKYIHNSSLDIINISNIDAINTKIKLYNLLGQNIKFERTNNSNSIQINYDNVQKGTYVLQIVEDKELKVYKFIKD